MTCDVCLGILAARGIVKELMVETEKFNRLQLQKEEQTFTDGVS